MMKTISMLVILLASLGCAQGPVPQPPGPPEFSGIYPHLAMFNNENECGTGAVVPWAGKLWAITYAPHAPKGSSDKLYEITPDLKQIVRKESIGGTPANRMIHRESQQLFIGPYAIDAKGNARVIPYATMYGRHTGNARHLTDPANKIYCATMEEGIYEIDVKTLDVKTLYHDEQAKGSPKADLPGYHGKGLYSGQGRVIYANNGDHARAALRDPFVPSGVLAEWNGKTWRVVRRAQFTEVTGLGGIFGNPNPKTDPVWCVGWDAKSVMVMMLDKGKWHTYRLPKASHSYDGAHGWNTEWPRIRDIGETDLLMTMHGMFWRFPKTFSAQNSAGIAPRSSYLKVVGDFCRWGDRVVLGCDDSAKMEFLNKRKAKGHVAGPQSQSNLWFVAPDKLDFFGPVLGRGAVWLNEAVTANTPSDAFLVTGFKQRGLHLVADAKTTITLEVDRQGNGQWATLITLDVNGYQWYAFDETLDATWIRLRSSKPLKNATAQFYFATAAKAAAAGKFVGIAKVGDKTIVGGIVRARGGNTRTLHFAAKNAKGKLGAYILDADMKLTPVKDAAMYGWMQKNAAIPSRKGVIAVDAASVIYIDDNGKRYRLPKNDAYTKAGPLGVARLCREVATERDLFNCHGTFYELPANNAGGFARVRPVTTHNLQINDYCSYRGLLVLSGINSKTASTNRHIIRSADGKAALWVGAIDDIWSLGKPVGVGGPWTNSAVKADTASDPYLMTGYDKKTLTLSSTMAVTITAEVDLSGMGDWVVYKTFTLAAGKTVNHEFPAGFGAYWIRFTSSAATTATAQLTYR